MTERNNLYNEELNMWIPESTPTLYEKYHKNPRNIIISVPTTWSASKITQYLKVIGVIHS